VSGEINFAQINGKQVDCVQSALRAAGRILAFTVRFTDGTLLRIDSDSDLGNPTLKVEIVHESKYLVKERKEILP
jgi:hypothetical protein